MTARIKKLRSVFARHGIGALLVTKDVNIAYLTGFPSRESWLLIGPRRAFYITDFRYMLEARKGLRGISVRRYTASIGDALFKALGEMGVKRIGIDERHLTVSQYRALERRRPKGVRLISANHLVENFRAIKDAGELKQVKEALRLHKQAHQFLKRLVKPDMSEKEVLLRLERFVKSRDAGFSFDPIIASGPNSCYPHAGITKRKFRANETVLIDMGIDVKGYKSDLTRMFFLGKISSFVKRVHDAVYAAQRKAIEQIRAGAAIADVDRAARNSLKTHGLAKYFGHAVGHGIGLEVHECPRLAQTNSSVLKEGMLLTVEPAVYIPGQFGIRIEDMVLVTKKACEILSDDIH